MHMSVLAFMYAYAPLVYLVSSQVKSAGIRVTDHCELPCRSWELSPCLLGKHPVLLTTEPSLQPR